MISSNIMYYYAVLSPEHDTNTFDACTSFLESYIPTISESYIFIKEYGKNGTHPHMNYVYETTVFPSNFRRKFFTEFPEHKGKRKLLKVKKVCDLSTLVCTYLQKEDESEIVDMKNIDLDLLRENAKPLRLSTELYKPQVLDKHTAHLHFRDALQKTSQKSDSTEYRYLFRKTYCEMVRQEFSFANVSMKRLYVDVKILLEDYPVVEDVNNLLPPLTKEEMRSIEKRVEERLFKDSYPQPGSNDEV